MVLNNERMRVKARMLLVGKSHIGKTLLFFNAFVRLLIRILITLLVLKFVSLLQASGGGIIIALSFTAAILAALLCECVRVAGDRWYLALCSEESANLWQIVLGFSAADFILAIKLRVRAGLSSFIRVCIFFTFPLAFIAFTLAVAQKGASLAVLSVLGAGSIILLLCGIGFGVASLGCVNLARTLCCYDVNDFRYLLKKLEASAASLFKYTLSLGFVNSAYRRAAKVIFAIGICRESATIMLFKNI